MGGTRLTLSSLVSRYRWWWLVSSSALFRCWGSRSFPRGRRIRASPYLVQWVGGQRDRAGSRRILCWNVWLITLSSLLIAIAGTKKESRSTLRSWSWVTRMSGNSFSTWARPSRRFSLSASLDLDPFHLARLLWSLTSNGAEDKRGDPPAITLTNLLKYKFFFFSYYKRNQLFSANSWVACLLDGVERRRRQSLRQRSHKIQTFSKSAD